MPLNFLALMLVILCTYKLFGSMDRQVGKELSGSFYENGVILQVYFLLLVIRENLAMFGICFKTDQSVSIVVF